MAGPNIKKRPREDSKMSRGLRPLKKQKKQVTYDSLSSEADDNQHNDPPLNFLDDSDGDIENMPADDVASSSAMNSSDGSYDSQTRKPSTPLKLSKLQGPLKRQFATDAPAANNESDNEGDGDERGSESEHGDEDLPGAKQIRLNADDSTAFSTSMAKMLAAKLSSTRRADPIVARSAETAAASRQALDAALEAKARRRLRDQKRLALERGRIRNVLMPSRGQATRKLDLATGAIVEGENQDGEERGMETVAEILAAEKALRKTAQRGVVHMYNAIFAAQLKATEAEHEVRSQSIIGAAQKEEKVAEMSRKGFLNLIASGGGRLKTSRIEEA